MTEDFLRRKLPEDFPVVFQKVKGDSFLDMADNCNTLCISDFTSKSLSDRESNCLKTCYKKSIEFEAYMLHEHQRIFVDELKKFNRRDGV
jgi:hypothetical protein